MAAEWIDSYQGDLSPWWFWQLCFCSVWARCPAERGEQTQRYAQLSHNSLQGLAILAGAVSIPHWDALSQYTFYGPCIESFQDCWWDPEFPQLSQMVQSLPGFLDLCLNVCSPSQVLGDVYNEVLEAAYSLHRGPADHKRSVGQQVSLSEVHNQLFSFAHIQRETVVLAPWCKSLHLIQVCGLIIVGMRPRTTVSSANLIIDVDLWEDTQSCVWRE